ncbi:MAG: BON domain-containing protein [Rhizobiaceae bacterium]|nr:MAG: BON domain-containing protein [Rhizobiaceae bacterium]
MRIDANIKADVEQELRFAPDVDETDIAIQCVDGVINLTGYARSYGDKYRAEAAAKRVSGVKGVANDIEVKLSRSDETPDPELARRIIAAMEFAVPGLDGKVKALVRDGAVSLEGSVEWGHQRERLESAVRHHRGVKSLMNLITVTPHVVAQDVKRKIEAAFVRSAQLDANRITVVADGGEVTLEGRVQSWSERQAAQQTAWAAPGVTRVNNRLTVGYG